MSHVDQGNAGRSFIGTASRVESVALQGYTCTRTVHVVREYQWPVM